MFITPILLGLFVIALIFAYRKDYMAYKERYSDKITQFTYIGIITVVIIIAIASIVYGTIALFTLI